MMNTDAAILLTIADQRARIAALEAENAELRAKVEAGPDFSYIAGETDNIGPLPTAVRDPA